MRDCCRLSVMRQRVGTSASARKVRRQRLGTARKNRPQPMGHFQSLKHEAAGDTVLPGTGSLRSNRESDTVASLRPGLNIGDCSCDIFEHVACQCELMRVPCCLKRAESKRGGYPPRGGGGRAAARSRHTRAHQTGGRLGHRQPTVSQEAILTRQRERAKPFRSRQCGQGYGMRRVSVGWVRLQDVTKATRRKRR